MMCVVSVLSAIRYHLSSGVIAMAVIDLGEFSFSSVRSPQENEHSRWHFMLKCQKEIQKRF